MESTPPSTARRRALITGGAGFVGSHLAEDLLDRDWAVHVIDDLSTGGVDNIPHLKEDPRFSYTIDSVMNRRLMAELVDQAEAVFHLAAAVGVRLIVEQPVRTIETNIRSIFARRSATSPVSSCRRCWSGSSPTTGGTSGSGSAPPNPGGPRLSPSPRCPPNPSLDV